jgi:hypothetical protein
MGPARLVAVLHPAQALVAETGRHRAQRAPSGEQLGSPIATKLDLHLREDLGHGQPSVSIRDKSAVAGSSGLVALVNNCESMRTVRRRQHEPAG